MIHRHRYDHALRRAQDLAALGHHQRAAEQALDACFWAENDHDEAIAAVAAFIYACAPAREAATAA